MGNQHSHTELRDRPAKKGMVMDRLRKSLRESFRRRKDHVPECSKPHQWQADEAAVRAGTCSFPVKYLGCVEVFESRGMQVCEEALRVLRNSRRRMIRGTLYVTGDGLRVVDDETKGLLVDQTIEKVSFCAPDRNNEKGFSYICRDGTTRRWMCHGFLSIKDSGERLSHAVGCAFAVCLERKQKRDKEAVTVNYDPQNSTFTRTGSFRQGSLTERLQDPQECKPADPPPVKEVHNPYAIARPHATPLMLQRQGSFRGFSSLNQASPFKRQLSLRISELPSNMERQRSMSLGSSDMFTQQNGMSVTPIPEASPQVERQDTISSMCQQLTQGLSFLSSSDNPFMTEANEQQDEGNPVECPPMPKPVEPPPRRSSPNFSHLRSHSMGSADSFFTQFNQKDHPEATSTCIAQSDMHRTEVTTLQSDKSASYGDPFNVEWVDLDHRHKPSTNPFVENPVKAFEIQM